MLATTTGLSLVTTAASVLLGALVLLASVAVVARDYRTRSVRAFADQMALKRSARRRRMSSAIVVAWGDGNVYTWNVLVRRLTSDAPVGRLC